MTTPQTASTCPSREDLAAFNEGYLPETALDTITLHVGQCTQCEKVLQTLTALPDGLLAELKTLKGNVRFTKEEPFDGDMALAECLGTHADARTPHREPPALLRDYQLLAKLGQGGMGAVYKAVHTRLDRTVALKVLTADKIPEADAIVRFQREMKAVGKLNHPNIIQATDAGEAEGTYFLVMEFAEGIDLARLVKRRGPLPVAEACELARQAAVALQHAHEHGLVHRDVKPSNLLLTTSGQVKLLDLGLALLRNPQLDGESKTATGFIMGSFDYMPPEQADDPHSVDARADLYSLGCTLYHLLAGQPPYASLSRSPMQTMKAHAHETPPPLESWRNDIPPRLSRLTGRLLAKAPADRPASARETARELAAFAAGNNLTALLDGSMITTSTNRVQDNTAPPTTSTRQPKRPRRPVLLAALGAVVGLLLGAILYVQTNTGVLEIIASDDDVRVSVESGGKEIVVIDPRQKKEVRLRAGDYRLRLVADGKEVALDRNEFTLTRAGKEIVTIRRVRKPVVVVPPAGKLPALDPLWVKSLGAMKPADQVQAVVEELKKRNPDYDGLMHHVVAGNQVVELSFPSGDIKDIMPVRALPHLKRLACNGADKKRGQITDLSPLHGLPLTTLHLVSTVVSDLSPLAGMPLQELVISWSAVTSLEPLATMTELKTLDLAFTQIADLSPLKGLPLRVLNVFETKVEDLSPLARMTTLKTLLCGDCPIDDLTPIKNLSLERLLITRSRVTSLTPLKDMKSLKYLNCGEMKLDDLVPLRGLELRELTVVFELRDADILRGMKSLQKINDKPVATFWKEQGKPE